jgi:hypothetical protein
LKKIAYFQRRIGYFDSLDLTRTDLVYLTEKTKLKSGYSGVAKNEEEFNWRFRFPGQRNRSAMIFSVLEFHDVGGQEKPNSLPTFVRARGMFSL